MQLYNYLFPQVVSVPNGYNCTVTVPYRLIENHLARRDVEIIASWKTISEGKEVLHTERSFGRPEGGRPPQSTVVFEWLSNDSTGRGEPVFGEIEIASAGQVPCFSSRTPVVAYTLAWKQGQKLIMSSAAYKYGSPQIILMVSSFGSFVEGFPAVHIDIARDIGQSLAMINPYLKPIVVDIVAGDGRSLPRMRIPARSVRYCMLSALMRPGETKWMGPIQLTASNRLICYVYKHALSDPTIVFDQEHLDPYRSDPTHIPLTQRWRLLFGEMMRRRRARA